MRLANYRAAREAEAHARPDLHFSAELVVADADSVACRLVFRCTPQRPFLGSNPTGAPVSFAEHVFYRFRDRRIAEGWSLIDRDAIAAQIAS